MKRRAWLAVGLVGVALAGCSSSGGDDAAGTTTVSIAETTTTTSVTTATAPDTTTTSPPTSTAPVTTVPATSPGWDDIKDAAIPSLCGHPATTLVDGKDTSLPVSDGYFELRQTLGSGTTGIVQNVPSDDAGPLTAVIASCNQGGVGWPSRIVLFKAPGTFYAAMGLEEDIDWATVGLNAPGRDGVSSIGMQGTKLVVQTSAEKGEDPSCCPTGQATVTMHAAGAKIVVDAVAKV